MVIHSISLFILTLLLLTSLPPSPTPAAKITAIGVKYYQVLFYGWIECYLSVNSKIRKANGPSSGGREAVICS